MLAEQHLYGSSRLGMRNPNLEMIGAIANADTAKMYLGIKNYELSNHLGNVLTVISDKKIQMDVNNDNVVDYYVADIISASDYYPFGSSTPGRLFTSSSYRYGFNGKEKDDEVNGSGVEYDYGMPIYDGRLCRFLTCDPFEKGYPMLSPYQFASNMPIIATDIDGLEANVELYGNSNDKGDVAHQKAEAEVVKQQTKSVNLVVSPAFSGLDFINTLKTQTKKEGSIKTLVIFSHAWQQGISFDYGGSGKNNFSMLGVPAAVGGPGPNFAKYSDLKAAVEKKEIIFDQNAIVFLGGCNCASTENTGTTGSLASNTAKDFGVVVIASKGQFTSKNENGSPTSVFTSEEGFYRYEKDKSGNVTETFIGKELDFAKYIDQFNASKPAQTTTAPEFVPIIPIQPTPAVPDATRVEHRPIPQEIKPK